MKNIPVIIIVLILNFFGAAHAQEFLTLGKQWVFEDMHYSNIWMPYSDTTIETITITADTVINSQLYWKLVLSRHPSCWNTENVEYLREDGEKVFRLSRNFDQEFLMIDFAESIEYEMLYDQGGNIDTGIVVIDSFGIEYAYDGTSINTQFMRIINNQSFDDDAPYKVYKNIGFLYPGFLFPDLGTGLCDFGDGITLRCVIAGLDTIHFTQYGCFELPAISSSKNAFSTSPIFLSPNPAIDFVSVPEGLTFLNMIDIVGRITSPNRLDNRISVKNYPSGLYTLRFISETENRIYSGKIIKY